jgi:hypothetical protein
MLEAGNLIAHFLRDIDHLRHFVGAIAMVVDQYLPVEHAAQRVHRQVAVRNLAALFLIAVPLALVIQRLEPGRAGRRNISHAR